MASSSIAKYLGSKMVSGKVTRGKTMARRRGKIGTQRGRSAGFWYLSVRLGKSHPLLAAHFRRTRWTRAGAGLRGSEDPSVPRHQTVAPVACALPPRSIYDRGEPSRAIDRAPRLSCLWQPARSPDRAGPADPRAGPQPAP